MLVWKVKVAGVLLGAGAVLGFWPIPPLCEQVLEKKKSNRRTPLPRSRVLLRDVGCYGATEPGHPSRGGKINLGWLQVSSRSHSASQEGGPGCRDPFPGLLND